MAAGVQLRPGRAASGHPPYPFLKPVNASLTHSFASGCLSRFDPELLPYRPNAGISGPYCEPELGWDSTPGGQATYGHDITGRTFQPEHHGPNIKARASRSYHHRLDIMALTFGA